MTVPYRRRLPTNVAHVARADPLDASPSNTATASHAIASAARARRTVQWQDWLLLTVACIGTFVVFGIQAESMGFYSDDAAFLVSLPMQDLGQTLRAAADYVPGRNLHIIWQQLLFLAAGASPADLGRLHLLQAALDAAAVGCLYVVARQLSLPPVWCFASAAIFAIYPNHGETHFWLSAAPMNLFSTIFTLGYASVAIRSIGRSRSDDTTPFVNLALAAELLLFLAALFTYDQTFAVLLFVLGVRLAILGIRRRYRLGLLLCGTYGAPILVYALLKANPASGPTLANVSLGHVLDTVIVSASVIVGDDFQTSLQSALDAATLDDRLGAALAALGFVLASVTGMLLGKGSVEPERDPGVTTRWREVSRRYVLILVLACAATVLAYLPTYVWFISPRHNFLPSAGLALALGAVGAWLASTATRLRPAGPVAVGVTLLGLVGAIVFVGVAANLSEKTSWISAYRLRLGLYTSLAASAAFEGRTGLVFENFPSHLNRTPFFAQENYFAADYLFPHQASLSMSGIGSISTPRGYFLYTEFDRYGIAPRYLPRNRALHLTYHGQTRDELLVETGGDGYRASDLYSISSEPLVGENPAGGQIVRAAYVDEIQRPTLKLAFELDTRSIAVASDGEVALILSARQGGNTIPISVRNAWGERMLIPVALQWGRDLTSVSGSVRLLVDLHQQASVRPNVAGLYVLSASVPRLLQEISLEGRDI
jgi:hypothetical protein